MRFRIGCYIYRVHISQDPIFEGNRELLGLAVYHNREILLSPALPAPQRLDVLLHELQHCWEFHVPAPRTDEDRANLSAMVTASTLADLEAQGGEASLRKLSAPRIVFDEPEPATDPLIESGPRYESAEQVDESQAIALSRAGRAQCATCESLIADGSIVTSVPRFDFVAFGNVVDRTLFCPHCGHLQRWTEGATMRGVPNGAVVDEPVATRVGVAEFLTKHPEAVGLVN